ncbi:dnaJ homolog subfamily C member 24-like [Ctenocephalides felis]|uniref:dnaJ homolog subfamily C member 24-like n=1 Tax=Ctenocephalides felis TaxID=7515 RepID=UPI000E6E11C7|nr:dnaJ homolog subfamily C member 24-like [Ctenocephalides felis]
MQVNEEKNLYDILGCQNDASSAEIRKAYQNLILKCHPDKCSSSQTDTYLSVTKAWKILGDPVSRKKYDAELFSEQSKIILYATLTRDELSYDDESEIYYYPCRCGGTYVIDEIASLNEDLCIGCDECSFSILVKKSV